MKVPRRDGQVLGATAFIDTQAARGDLPLEVKERLKDVTAIHD